jgi:hypothetical protein
MMDTQTDDQPTCGHGLAANAVLPAKLAELMAAQADVLERHMRALDPSDLHAQRELEAYASLTGAHRALATELTRLAEEMAGCRDLPMAEHDMAAMTDPRGQAEAFRRFVGVERELLALLEAKLNQEAQLLA